jgi:hypothetical protein
MILICYKKIAGQMFLFLVLNVWFTHVVDRWMERENLRYTLCHQNIHEQFKTRRIRMFSLFHHYDLIYSLWFFLF